MADIQFPSGSQPNFNLLTPLFQNPATDPTKMGGMPQFGDSKAAAMGGAQGLMKGIGGMMGGGKKRGGKAKKGKKYPMGETNQQDPSQQQSFPGQGTSSDPFVSSGGLGGLLGSALAADGGSSQRYGGTSGQSKSAPTYFANGYEPSKMITREQMMGNCRAVGGPMGQKQPYQVGEMRPPQMPQGGLAFGGPAQGQTPYMTGEQGQQDGGLFNQQFSQPPQTPNLGAMGGLPQGMSIPGNNSQLPGRFFGGMMGGGDSFNAGECGGGGCGYDGGDWEANPYDPNKNGGVAMGSGNISQLIDGNGGVFGQDNYIPGAFATGGQPPTGRPSMMGDMPSPLSMPNNQAPQGGGASLPQMAPPQQGRPQGQPGGQGGGFSLGGGSSLGGSECGPGGCGPQGGDASGGGNYGGISEKQGIANLKAALSGCNTGNCFARGGQAQGGQQSLMGDQQANQQSPLAVPNNQAPADTAADPGGFQQAAKKGGPQGMATAMMMPAGMIALEKMDDAHCPENGGNGKGKALWGAAFGGAVPGGAPGVTGGASPRQESSFANGGVFGSGGNSNPLASFTSGSPLGGGQGGMGGPYGASAGGQGIPAYAMGGGVPGGQSMITGDNMPSPLGGGSGASGLPGAGGASLGGAKGGGGGSGGSMGLDSNSMQAAEIADDTHCEAGYGQCNVGPDGGGAGGAALAGSIDGGGGGLGGGGLEGGLMGGMLARGGNAKQGSNYLMGEHNGIRKMAAGGTTGNGQSVMLGDQPQSPGVGSSQQQPGLGQTPVQQYGTGSNVYQAMLGRLGQAGGGAGGAEGYKQTPGSFDAITPSLAGNMQPGSFDISNITGGRAFGGPMDEQQNYMTGEQQGAPRPEIVVPKSGNDPYVVGQNGPEIHTPREDSFVIPNPQTQQEDPTAARNAQLGYEQLAKNTGTDNPNLKPNQFNSGDYNQYADKLGGSQGQGQDRQQLGGFTQQQDSNPGNTPNPGDQFGQAKMPGGDSKSKFSAQNPFGGTSAKDDNGALSHAVNVAPADMWMKLKQSVPQAAPLIAKEGIELRKRLAGNYDLSKAKPEELQAYAQKQIGLTDTLRPLSGLKGPERDQAYSQMLPQLRQIDPGAPNQFNPAYLSANLALASPLAAFNNIKNFSKQAEQQGANGANNGPQMGQNGQVTGQLGGQVPSGEQMAQRATGSPNAVPVGLNLANQPLDKGSINNPGGQAYRPPQDPIQGGADKLARQVKAAHPGTTYQNKFFGSNYDMYYPSQPELRANIMAKNTPELSQLYNRDMQPTVPMFSASNLSEPYRQQYIQDMKGQGYIDRNDPYWHRNDPSVMMTGEGQFEGPRSQYVFKDPQTGFMSYGNGQGSPVGQQGGGGMNTQQNGVIPNSMNGYQYDQQGNPTGAGQYNPAPMDDDPLDARGLTGKIDQNNEHLQAWAMNNGGSVNTDNPNLKLKGGYQANTSMGNNINPQSPGRLNSNEEWEQWARQSGYSESQIQGAQLANLGQQLRDHLQGQGFSPVQAQQIQSAVQFQGLPLDQAIQAAGPVSRQGYVQGPGSGPSEFSPTGSNIESQLRGRDQAYDQFQIDRQKGPTPLNEDYRNTLIQTMNSEAAQRDPALRDQIGQILSNDDRIRQMAQQHQAGLKGPQTQPYLFGSGDGQTQTPEERAASNPQPSPATATKGKDKGLLGSIAKGGSQDGDSPKGKGTTKTSSTSTLGGSTQAPDEKREREGRAGQAYKGTGYQWSEDGSKLEPIPGGPATKVSSDTAGRFAQYKVATDTLGQVNGMLFNKDGSVNRTVLNTSVTTKGIPFTEGREYKSIIHRSIDAAVRAASGATINPDEWPKYEAMYMPLPGDTDRQIKEKLKALNDFVFSAKGAIDKSGEVEKGVNERIEEDGNSFGGNSSSGGGAASELQRRGYKQVDGKWVKG